MTASSRLRVLLVGIAVSALLLWISVRNIRFDDVLRTMADADLWLILPFTACLLVFYLIRSYRWKILLSPISQVTSRELFGPVMIGYGANFLLPFQLGEVARSVAAMEKTRLPFMPIAFSILVERVFDFMVILSALSISLATHEALPDYVGIFGVALGAAVFLLLLGMIAFAMKTEAVLAAFEKLLRVAPERIRTAVISQLRSGATGLASLRSRTALLAAAATSLMQWSLIAVCIWISLVAVGASVPAHTVVLILALIVLGSSIPNAPGYLGSFQAGYVVGLEAIGGDPVQGLSASIFYHVIYAATAILLGLAALKRSSLDWKTVIRRQPEAPG